MDLKKFKNISIVVVALLLASIMLVACSPSKGSGSGNDNGNGNGGGDNTIKPTSISIATEGGKSDLDENDTLQLSITVEPSDASKDVKWTVEGDGRAVVSEDGLVGALKKGAVKVTATSKVDSSKTTTIDLTINGDDSTGGNGGNGGGNNGGGNGGGETTKPDAKEIIIFPENGATSLYAMGTLKLNSFVLPNGAVQDVKYAITEGSDNATVDENTGLVTGKKEGEVVVKATQNNISNTIKLAIKSSLSISGNLYFDSTTQLKVENNSDLTISKTEWHSDNEQLVTIDNTGKLTVVEPEIEEESEAVADQTVNITATVTINNNTTTLSIPVVVTQNHNKIVALNFANRYISYSKSLLYLGYSDISSMNDDELVNIYEPSFSFKHERIEIEKQIGTNSPEYKEIATQISKEISSTQQQTIDNTLSMLNIELISRVSPDLYINIDTVLNLYDILRDENSTINLEYAAAFEVYRSYRYFFNGSGGVEFDEQLLDDLTDVFDGLYIRYSDNLYLLKNSNLNENSYVSSLNKLDLFYYNISFSDISENVERKFIEKVNEMDGIKPYIQELYDSLGE